MESMTTGVNSMAKKTEPQMTSSTKCFIKGLLIICIVIVVFLGFVNLFGLLRYSDAKKARINDLYNEAEMVNYYLSDYLINLHISDETSYILQGEYRSDYCLIYTNELITEDTIIYGKPNNGFQRYWSAKVNGTKVEEVWTSKKKLNESELHPYSLAEQESSVHFVSIFAFIKWHRLGWVDDTNLVGYYKRP